MKIKITDPNLKTRIQNRINEITINLNQTEIDAYDTYGLRKGLEWQFLWIKKYRVFDEHMASFVYRFFEVEPKLPVEWPEDVPTTMELVYRERHADYAKQIDRLNKIRETLAVLEREYCREFPNNPPEIMLDEADVELIFKKYV